MTPHNPSDLAQRRFILLTVLRAGGVALMLVGLWIMLGSVLPDGDRVGGLIFVLGVGESLLLPTVLAAKWRTPPRA